jgi:flagellar M-ring protein FliF
MEINQITDLVKSAVGFDQTRNDNVTVISRKFAGADAAADTGPAWYDNAWLPVLARNGTAIVIALLVLLLGVRPIAKALMKKREDATPRPAFGQTIEGAEGEDAEALTGPVVVPPVSLDQLESSRGYDERVGAVRGFTRDNPTRAALAVRDMIKADAR